MPRQSAHGDAGATIGAEAAITPQAAPCPFCRDSVAWTGRSWAFWLPVPIVSMNERHVNQGHARHVYRKQRTQWEWAVAVASRVAGVTPATGRRRVQITRIAMGDERELDPDNLVGGAKPLLDALVKSRLLLSDKRKHVIAHYDDIHERELRHLSGPRAPTRVVITDLVIP